MKKIIISVMIVATVISCSIKGINVNEHGIMIDFVDNTGYWLEFKGGMM